MRDFVSAASQICDLLPYYPEYSGNFVPTLQDDPSFPSSRMKKTSWPLKMGPIGFPLRRYEIYHCTLGNMPEERRSHLQTTKYRPIEKETRDGNMWRNTWQSLDGWMNEFVYCKMFTCIMIVMDFLTILSILEIRCHRMLGILIDDDLKRIGKAAVMP